MRSVAAVIPHFFDDRERSLKLAIEALRQQTFAPREIIVWNNSQRTLELGENVRVINSPRNIGSFARFFAALTATTDYVFFQDNDIAVGPSALETLMEWTKKKPGILSLHGYKIPVGGSYDQREFAIGVRDVVRVNVTLGRAELVPWSTVPRALLELDRIPVMDDLWFSARCRDMRVPIYVVPYGELLVNLPGWDTGVSSEDFYYEERDRIYRSLFPAPKEASIA